MIRVREHESPEFSEQVSHGDFGKALTGHGGQRALRIPQAMEQQAAMTMMMPTVRTKRSRFAISASEQLAQHGNPCSR